MYNVYKSMCIDGLWGTEELVGQAENIQYVAEHLTEFGFTEEELSGSTFDYVNCVQVFISKGTDWFWGEYPYGKLRLQEVI